MGLMNGMEAAGEIRKVDDEVTIIFITNMAQYAIKGYAVNAMDYVLKPMSYPAFAESLKKQSAELQGRKNGSLPSITVMAWSNCLLQILLLWKAADTASRSTHRRVPTKVLRTR